MDFTSPGYTDVKYTNKTEIKLESGIKMNADKEQYAFVTSAPWGTLLNLLTQRECFTVEDISRHGIYNVIKFLSVDNCTSIFGLNLGKLGSVLDAIDSDDIDYSALYKIQFDIVQTTKDDKSMQLYTASVWLWDNDQNEYKPMKIIITLN